MRYFPCFSRHTCWHILLWTSHISRALSPHAASGCLIGQHSSKRLYIEWTPELVPKSHRDRVNSEESSKVQKCPQFPIELLWKQRFLESSYDEKVEDKVGLDLWPCILLPILNPHSTMTFSCIFLLSIFFAIVHCFFYLSISDIIISYTWHVIIFILNIIVLDYSFSKSDSLTLYQNIFIWYVVKY